MTVLKNGNTPNQMRLQALQPGRLACEKRTCKEAVCGVWAADFHNPKVVRISGLVNVSD